MDMVYMVGIAGKCRNEDNRASGDEGAMMTIWGIMMMMTMTAMMMPLLFDMTEIQQGQVV